MNQIKKFKDIDGILIPLELKNVDFEVKRIFWVYNVPKNTIRGNHSHYTNKQLLICIKGEIDVILDYGDKKETTKIIEGQSVLVPEMVWDSQKFLTGNDILLVLCSIPYDENDYINEYDKFISLK